MDLNDLTLFKLIATTGSLSAAGRRIGATPMVVSRRLAALEHQLGTRLFNRTTRSLSLTSEGESFLPYVDSLLETQEEAIAALSPTERGLAGQLKVTAPNVFGHSILVPLLAEIMAANPALKVDLTLSDGVLDIVRTGIDVAIRVAPLQPSELISARLADNPRILCASPAYIARFGKPDTLSELANHPCLRLHGMSEWPFIVDGEVKRIRVVGPFSASSVDAVRSACLAGLGIAMTTYWDVGKLLDRRELVSIELADALPDRLAIWAVYPSRRYTPPRVRALVEALKERLTR
jgi:DNA-binding transcriptional LysR family regulator